MQSESTCPRCGTGRGVEAGAPDRPSGGTRWTLLRGAAESRGIPLWTIVTILGLAATVYVGGKVLYRLRDILILLAVSGFIALILNPLVVMLQRRIAPRRSIAVAIVTVSAVLISVGVVVGCGYPLAAGTTHLANQLPGYGQRRARPRLGRPPAAPLPRPGVGAAKRAHADERGPGLR